MAVIISSMLEMYIPILGDALAGVSVGVSLTELVVDVMDIVIVDVIDIVEDGNGDTGSTKK